MSMLRVSLRIARTFSTDIKSGTVKWFDTTKGFGFITPSDGSPDVFVHQSSIHAAGFRSLRDGESVEFTVETDFKGKTKASKCTGPNGDFVQGAERQSQNGGGNFQRSQNRIPRKGNSEEFGGSL